MKRSWSLLCALCLLVGCYTFRAGTDVDASRLERLRRSPASVTLVIDAAYSGFESKDRGHSVADPQTYVLGPSLAELTEKYFRHAFASVTVVERPGAGTGTLVVHPSVARFDNELRIGEANQTLEIDLAAEVTSAAGASLGTARGRGSSTHQIHLMRDDEARIGTILGQIIQEALASLVQEVATLAERR